MSLRVLPVKLARFIQSILLAGACLFVLTISTAATAAAPRILILGDSLSAGFGIASEAAWPSLLDARLQRDGLDYNVVNASISGETSSGGASRITALLDRHRPAVLVLALGANDGLRGLPLPTLRNNLAAMTTAARRAGARVLLIGMRLPPNYGPYANEFFTTFAEVARQQQVAHLPFLLAALGTDEHHFQPDRLHPTAAAQPLILDTVWPALAPLLKKSR